MYVVKFLAYTCTINSNGRLDGSGIQVGCGRAAGEILAYASCSRRMRRRRLLLLLLLLSASANSHPRVIRLVSQSKEEDEEEVRYAYDLSHMSRFASSSCCRSFFFSLSLSRCRPMNPSIQFYRRLWHPLIGFSLHLLLPNSFVQLQLTFQLLRFERASEHLGGQAGLALVTIN